MCQPIDKTQNSLVQKNIPSPRPFCQLLFSPQEESLYTHTVFRWLVMDDVRRPISRKSDRFMDRFRLFMRARHLAYKTEKAYCYWVQFYIGFHKKRNPKAMAGLEIEQFLEFLTTDRSVAASTKKGTQCIGLSPWKIPWKELCDRSAPYSDGQEDVGRVRPGYPPRTE